MNRTLLEQPFAPAQIKQRRGRTGGVLEASALIKELSAMRRPGA